MSKLFTERYWNMLWRKAVLKLWHGRCAMCGDPDVSHIEVHHVVHRRNKLLRWDLQNGIPLCSVVTNRNKDLYKGKTCHQWADTGLGRIIIDNLIDRDYLNNLEVTQFKDYLTSHSINEVEFEQQQMDKIKEVLK